MKSLSCCYGIQIGANTLKIGQTSNFNRRLHDYRNYPDVKFLFYIEHQLPIILERAIINLLFD
jgi:hypothetical protein